MNTFQTFGVILFAHVTVMTSVAMVLIWFARRRPAFQHTVGVIGLILTLGSPILTLELPQSNWLLASKPSNATPDLTMSNSPENVPTFSGSEPVFPLAGELAAIERIGPGGPPTSTTQDRPPFSFDVDSKTILAVSVNSLFAVWFLGSVLAAYRLWSSLRALRRLSRSWTPISSTRLQRIEHDVCLALKLDKLPMIRVAQLAPVPLVMGLLKPVVVLPQECADHANDERLRDVLIHECAHIVRRDPWVLALQHATAILFWIHPAIYWLNQQISRVREELCDNFVIQQGNAVDYAQTLLDFSESCGRQQYSLSTLGLFSSRWTLEERIRDLLDSNRRTITQVRWGTRLGLGVLFGIISVLIGGIDVVNVSSADQQAESSKSLNAKDAPAKTPQAAQVPTMRKIIIRGQCIDDEMTALPNVAIRVYRYQNYSEPPVFVASAQSDSDGLFKLNDVESSNRDMWDLLLTAKATGHASIIRQIRKDEDDDDEMELKLSSKPQTLSGIVTDVNGKPIPKVLVSQFPLYPPPDVLSAITDEQGRYEITDATEWIPQNRQGVINGRAFTFGNEKRVFQLRHPDFPMTSVHYTKIPQQVNVTLKPPAIIEGKVIDAMTKQPVSNVTVSAQGVARRGWFQTKTDNQGRYRLKMTKDHYNIWAEMDERIAIAVKAIEAIPGKTSADADIEMVQGGFVVGRLINGETNEPITIPEGETRYVAHYGPARPRTGAAVTSTKVNPDGTYRLRVAPGRNYVYLMNSDMAQFVTVEDGDELKFDLVSSKSEVKGLLQFDPDQMLQSELLQKALKEDADEEAANEKGTDK